VTPARWLALLLAGGAVASGGLGATAQQPGAATGAVVPAVATPLWSARRAPQPLVDWVGGRRLEADLAAVVTGDACFVVSTPEGVIASSRADTPLIGASTQKLLVGAAALSALGADTRLATRVMAPRAAANGTIERLWLVGGGDALLATPDFAAALEKDPVTRGTPTTSLAGLADAVYNAGIRRVTNGVEGDDSRYDTLRYLPTWKDSYRATGQIGPVGALTVNRGFRVLTPNPIAVDDPAAFAAAQLTTLLQARGITVGAAAKTGRATADAVEVARVESVPMKDLVASLIRSSDNLLAEDLTREIGRTVVKEATTAAGTRAVVQKLGELGVPTTGVVLTDGSGLDRGNRVTCRTLATTLALGQRPELRALWDGLPVAGQTGTLSDELGGTAVQGHLRGKTGSLDGVTGLVGTVDAPRALQFALIENGTFSEQTGIMLRGRFATTLPGFPAAPNGDALVPAPAAPPPGRGN
jgi:D-alanyl-D-alanine carboxypeptidase/D-alanyl-D-alanine-endopeptidase (penicillin-binding protein 4)